jgi:hypothetical protein
MYNSIYMKKIIAIVFLITCFCSYNSAQNVGINTTGATANPAALLDLNTGNNFASPNGMGLLIPHVALASSTDAATIPTPPTSLLVYVPSGSGLAPAGFYYNSGTSAAPNWIMLGPNTVTSWLLTGNAGTTPGTDFLGTTDANALEFKVNSLKSGWIDYATPFNTFFGYQAGAATAGSCNTVFGYEALFTNTGASSNTAIGKDALFKSIAGGVANTAIGDSALYSNTTGEYNTATGYQAMHGDKTGISNAAYGYDALGSNTNGSGNVAIGDSALYYNTKGSANIAVGAAALTNNVAGSDAVAVGYAAMFNANNTATAYNNLNVAVGYQALEGSSTPASNTGNNNTALGAQSLLNNSSGNNNSMTGFQAGYNNSTGSNNSCSGNQALYNNVAGSSNVAIGFQAGYNNTSSENVFLGDSSGYINTTGVDNTFIGYNSGITVGSAAFSNVTSLGYQAQSKASNSVNLGNTSVTNIYAQVTGITGYSDRRVKDDIRNNVPGLAFINKLKPVTFRYNIHRENKLLGINDGNDYPGKYAIENITQSGFIAQQVDSAANECHYDFSGIDKPKNPQDLYGLNYTAFVVPLVKAVQELSIQNDSLMAEHSALELQVNKQDAKQAQINARLQKEIAELKELLDTASLKAN